MLGPDEPALLTCRAKPALIRSGCQSLQPLSKNNRLSLTPGLHLSAAPAQEALLSLKSSSPSSSNSFSSPSSSSNALPTSDEVRCLSECSESQKELENLPPRRPLKLAPLELPLEVKEAQWQKMSDARKLDAALDEPCESGQRKGKSKGKGTTKSRGRDGSPTSPARTPLSTIANPPKRQQHANAGKVLLLPVAQLQLDIDDDANVERSVGKVAGSREAGPTPPGFRNAPLSPSKIPSVRQKKKVYPIFGQLSGTKQTAGQLECEKTIFDQSTCGERKSACAEKTSEQSAHTEVLPNQMTHSERTPDQMASSERIPVQSVCAKRMPDQSGGCERMFDQLAFAKRTSDQLTHTKMMPNNLAHSMRMPNNSAHSMRMSDQPAHIEKMSDQSAHAGRMIYQTARSKGTSNQLAHAKRASDQSASSEAIVVQSHTPLLSQDTGRIRPRLRRAQRLEEDQSKSGSSAGGLSADESKVAGVGVGAGGHSMVQRHAEAALREGRMLEKVAYRNLTGNSRMLEAAAGRRLVLSAIKQH